MAFSSVGSSIDVVYQVKMNAATDVEISVLSVCSRGPKALGIVILLDVIQLSGLTRHEGGNPQYFPTNKGGGVARPKGHWL